jgi:hypothetical protein
MHKNARNLELPLGTCRGKLEVVIKIDFNGT